MAEDEQKFELTKDEIEEVQNIINQAAPGRYTLRQLFGKKGWNCIGSDGDKRDYGQRFRASYQKGQLRNITENGHKSFSIAYNVGWF